MSFFARQPKALTPPSSDTGAEANQDSQPSRSSLRFSTASAAFGLSALATLIAPVAMAFKMVDRDRDLAGRLKTLDQVTLLMDQGSLGASIPNLLLGGTDLSRRGLEEPNLIAKPTDPSKLPEQLEVCQGITQGRFGSLLFDGSKSTIGTIQDQDLAKFLSGVDRAQGITFSETAVTEKILEIIPSTLEVLGIYSSPGVQLTEKSLDRFPLLKQFFFAQVSQTVPDLPPSLEEIQLGCDQFNIAKLLTELKSAPNLQRVILDVTGEVTSVLESIGTFNRNNPAIDVTVNFISTKGPETVNMRNGVPMQMVLEPSGTGYNAKEVPYQPPSTESEDQQRERAVVISAS
ncbi:MAG: hypothetical protein ACK5GN_11515 [Pseudomonadota bacterium]|jgi:hypothetical protein